MDETNTGRSYLSVPLAKIRTENFVSKWYLPSEIDILVESALPGDLLEFSRGIYKHWGVYVGKTNLGVDLRNGVVHAFIPGGKFFLPCSNLRIICRFVTPLDPDKAYVDCSELREVLGNSQVRINNSGDVKNMPFDPVDIIDRAVKAIGFYEDYSLLKNNCEHFVNICRYGIGNCNQVNNAALWAGLTAAFGIAGTIIINLLKR